VAVAKAEAESGLAAARAEAAAQVEAARAEAAVAADARAAELQTQLDQVGGRAIVIGERLPTTMTACTDYGKVASKNVPALISLQSWSRAGGLQFPPICTCLHSNPGSKSSRVLFCQLPV
jgi:hypothetical protein